MRRSLLALVASTILAAAFAGTASASHSWGNYHWARTSNPFTVKLIDSMTVDWDDNLDVAISDWDASSVLNVAEEAGDDSQNVRKRCRPVSGKVRACNANYGFNGWLGLAQIWVTGGVHITQGTAKMNDTYLASGYTEENRQHVICQEIGHDWGLGHQDESGADLNTCMDYSRDLDNPHPNAHDYQQLETIYNSHTDSSSTVAPAAASPGEAGSENAQPVAIERNDRITNSVITERFADGTYRITHIFWALGGPGR